MALDGLLRRLGPLGFSKHRLLSCFLHEVLLRYPGQIVELWAHVFVDNSIGDLQVRLLDTTRLH